MQSVRTDAHSLLMGFNFNFFGEQEHRVFNYKPRYYDPEKEERRRFFGDHSDASVGTKDGEEKAYTPGKYLSGSFRDGNYQRLRTTSSNRTQKIIGIVGLILFFVVLYFIAKFYMLILG